MQISITQIGAVLPALQQHGIVRQVNFARIDFSGVLNTVLNPFLNK
jgi:hypothetical protein